MKKLFLLIGLLILVVGCKDIGTQSAEQADRAQVEHQQSQYNKSQPPPFFDWSLERDIAIQLYQSRNERVKTWTVWRSDYGLIEGDCESIGYPIPYDVQLTNPLKVEKVSGYQSITSSSIEQAEPNGLYSSHNSTATWIRSVIEHDGKVMEVPIYIEGKVTCYPYPVTVDYEKNLVKRVDSKPSVVLKPKN